MGWGSDGFGWIGVLAVCLIVVGIITFFALRGRNRRPASANAVSELTISRGDLTLERW